MTSLRAKLLLLFVLILAIVLSAVGWMVSHTMARTFEQFSQQRTAVLVEQFRREFERRGAEVVRSVESIASSDAALRLALALSRGGDTAPFVHSAGELAATHQLEVVILADKEGRIISSAHHPARFGYREDWLARDNAGGAFLQQVEFPSNTPAVALLGARSVSAGNAALRIAGGRRLDSEFLTSLTLPQGMRALLYNLEAGELISASGIQSGAERLTALPGVGSRAAHPVRGEQWETQGVLVQWGDDAASAERFHALPLLGSNGELLAVLLLGSSQRELVETQRRIRNMVLGIALAGLILATFLSGWTARRITQPLEELSLAVGEVAAGNWEARVEVQRSDEAGRLAEAFNAMTGELVSQRERLRQSERVAAWRELARRLAHELKNPLFPLQITVENMVRARQQAPLEFDEVFRESATTLLAELGNLKEIVARFSDFARMPSPQLQPVAVNELMRQASRLAQARAQAGGGKPVEVQSELDQDVGELQADPDLLYRAVQNLVFNALDAMPDGGRLTLRSRWQAGTVVLEVSDTGPGLTAEECSHLFTPYYTTRAQGTGLGLAIVQSVVSDHGGQVAVESPSGQGTTFRITLPVRSRAGAAGMNP